MSATNCPETPRQKMISMMYLVYTALLALNVSTEVLNGFTVVQQSLVQSITSTEGVNESLMIQFENSYNQNKVKVKPLYDQAIEVRAESQRLYDQIEALKVKIIRTCDGIDASVPDSSITADQLQKKDNLDIPYQIADRDENGVAGKGLGYPLMDSIAAYKEYMMSLSEKYKPNKADSTLSALSKTIKETFDTSDYIDPKEPSKVENWVERTFGHMPAIAVMTVLTRYQQSIRNTEADIIRLLHTSTDAGDFRVNKITAEVIPVSAFVTRGGQYEAKIILAAVDSTKKPTVTVNGQVLDGDVYRAGCGSVGTFDISGTIAMPTPSGEIKTYPFKSQYMVSEPTAIISADLMNTLYAGIVNPVSVSVPGIPSSNVSISATNVKSMTKTGTGWNLIPASVGTNCTINVSIKKADGSTQALGGKQFNVRALPDPVAYLSYSGGAFYGTEDIAIPRGSLQGASVKAEMPKTENISASYSVQGFTIKITDNITGNVQRLSSGSSALTAQQISAISKMKSGQQFSIIKITAVGADGLTRKPKGIAVEVK